jgi:hypothetical protein
MQPLLTCALTTASILLCSFAQAVLDCAFQLGKNTALSEGEVLQSPEKAGGTRGVDLVAPLLVNLGFCRIRFWYLVASASGISRETSRNYFWNLTLFFCRCGGARTETGHLYGGRIHFRQLDIA